MTASISPTSSRCGAEVTLNHGRTLSPVYSQATAEPYHVRVDNGNLYRIYVSQRDSTTFSVLAYRDEPRHLGVYEHQTGFQIRMRQFYDRWLCDKPAPRWIESGRSFLKREGDRAMVEQNGNGNRPASRTGSGGE